VKHHIFISNVKKSEQDIEISKDYSFVKKPFKTLIKNVIIIYQFFKLIYN